MSLPRKKKARFTCQVFQCHRWADEGELQDTRCSPSEVVRCMELKQSNCCQSIFCRSTNLSFSNSTDMWMSAEQLVKSYYQIKALCIPILHLQDCLALGSTGYRSPAYLLHKLKYTHRQTDTPPVSCRALWNSSSPHTSIVHWVFPKKGKADFSIFKVQGMVVTLHRARKGNALVCDSVEKYTLFPCRATKFAS